MKRGLTLGKFAPLHEGHRHLIETALSEMDEVVVIVYDCPETTFVPLNVRADWLRTLYPEAEIVEAWNGPSEVGDDPETKRRHEDYVLNDLKIRDITYFFSGEFYGEHMSRALGAVERVVDRELVPISGTMVRENPFAFREHLHPVVYRDLISNVVFLGAPSTGKTTLAARLAHEYDTVWMPEYGREYWEHKQVERRLSLSQLEEIAEEHLVREDDLLLRADRFLFTDTNALTTYVFSLYYHGEATPKLRELASEAASRYDLIFLCDTDIPYDETWDRSGKANRAVFQKRILGELAARKIPFFVLSGDLEARVRRAKSILDGFEKYANVMGLA